MTKIRVAALAALLVGFAASAGAQAVKLEFHDGKVNLTAQNASMRAILAEWARLGGTQVVNADRLSGPPLTLQLTDVTETQALDTILRGNAGYIAGQRPVAVPVGNRSALDRIMVVSTVGTGGPVAGRPSNTPPTPPPFAIVQPRQQAQPQPDPDDDPVSDVPPDDDQPPNRVRRPPPINATRPGAAQPFEVQDDDDDAPQQAPAPAPGNPFGVQGGSSRPGTISPVPQRPQGPRPQADPEP